MPIDPKKLSRRSLVDMFFTLLGKTNPSERERASADKLVNDAYGGDAIQAARDHAQHTNQEIKEGLKLD